MAQRRLSDEQTKELAARIRRFGEARGLKSDRAIADSAHLAPKAVADIETSISGPRLTTLLALCEGLGLYSVDQLLGFSSTSFFAHRTDIRRILGPVEPAFLDAVDEP